MAIARKKNTGRPSNLDRQIKRSVELAPYAAYVPNPEEKASHLKTVLAVEGETVGTTNTQTLTNKTFPEPTSDSSPAKITLTINTVRRGTRTTSPPHKTLGQ